MLRADPIRSEGEDAVRKPDAGVDRAEPRVAGPRRSARGIEKRRPAPTASLD
jgi:hypothetical protein